MSQVFAHGGGLDGQVCGSWLYRYLSPLQLLLGVLKGKVKVRVGLQELVDYCLRRGFRLVIVSNGLGFYIGAVLKELGLKNIEVHAAQACFHPEGMERTTLNISPLKTSLTPLGNWNFCSCTP
jgi:2-hydroxy-3-keto-5-methylthiopentenyl-1-phosphate phosphatase